MARSTKAEVERRLALIYPLVVLGAAPAAIAAHLLKHGSLYLSRRTLSRYVASCRERMLAEGRIERHVARAESLACKRLLLQRALAKGDVRTALAAQQAIDRTFGYFTEVREDDRSEMRRFLDAMDGGKCTGEGE